MGVITIKGLRLMARHGVMEQERRVGNMFEVDIVIDVPCADVAMATDQIDDTINYAEIVRIVKAEMATPSKLIENVALRIKEAIADHFDGKIASGSITVKKLAPPIPAELDYVAYTHAW